MKLYTYYRSTAAYRVRIVLNLKGIACEYHYIDLKKGAQKHDSYTHMNPQGLVPALELADGTILTQSLTIIDYLNHLQPEPALYPKDETQLFYVKDCALLIACDMHPLNNLRVLKYLSPDYMDEAARLTWYHHWLREGFNALEEKAKKHAGTFMCGDALSLADVCLVPQIYNANRFEFDMTPYPILRRINSACEQLDAFKKASPEQQLDCDLVN